MEIQQIYQETIKFAAGKHQEKNQTVPGTNLPYTVHISNVAMEILIAASHTHGFNTILAIQAALLHDVLEDTDTGFDEIEQKFGIDVATGVLALTKDKLLDKKLQMPDSLSRIKLQPKEIWAVKLADRINNLQPPPYYWNKEKKINYAEEAKMIYNELHEGNKYLAARLKVKIEEYKKYYD